MTDMHVGLAGEDTYGVDVRANFLATLAAVAAARPDYLVLSGDLCYRDGQVEIYRWLKTQLDACGIPYAVIAGNHDDAGMMAKVFGLSGYAHSQRIYYELLWQGHPVLFLDTAPYDLDTTQLDWLAARLAAAPVARILFIHHPPVLAQVPFMDQQYPLRN